MHVQVHTYMYKYITYIHVHHINKLYTDKIQIFIKQLTLYNSPWIQSSTNSFSSNFKKCCTPNYCHGNSILKCIYEYFMILEGDRYTDIGLQINIYNYNNEYFDDMRYTGIEFPLGYKLISSHNL